MRGVCRRQARRSRAQGPADPAAGTRPSGRDDAFLTPLHKDLVERPVEEGWRLFDDCGLEWKAGHLDPDRWNGPVRTFSASQVRQPVHTASIGAWREFAGLLAPLKAALERALG